LCITDVDSTVSSNSTWENIAPIEQLKCDLDFSFHENDRKFLCLIASSTAERALVNQSFWSQDLKTVLSHFRTEAHVVVCQKEMAIKGTKMRPIWSSDTGARLFLLLCVWLCSQTVITIFLLALGCTSTRHGWRRSLMEQSFELLQIT